MARLITVTKVGLYDINGSYFAVDSESIRVYDQNISSIETHTSGASLMFGNPQVTPEGVTVKGFVVSQTPAQIQTLIDASVSTTNPVSVISADGAISIPSVNTTFYFTKAGVAVTTLAAPTATTHDGLRLTFVATTAQANTITHSAGFGAGGASLDVATFGGAIGDNITIEAYQGKWYIVATRNVTIA
jgi:hypothetical protein